MVMTVAVLADPKSGSVLESLTRVALWRAKLLPPESQYAFHAHTGELVGYVDFAWPLLRLLLEADGFEFHSTRAQHRNDCRRLNAFTCRGWWLLRVTWEDVVYNTEEFVETVRKALCCAAALAA
jgi:very-short-patch-repair endonuclease